MDSLVNTFAGNFTVLDLRISILTLQLQGKTLDSGWAFLFSLAGTRRISVDFFSSPY